MLINCARGKLTDEQALYDALEKGVIAGAAIDVYSAEPAVDNVLVKCDKVVVTPHLAASTVEAERNAGTDVAKQVADVLRGLPPATPVNAPINPPEHMALIGPFMDVAPSSGRSPPVHGRPGEGTHHPRPARLPPRHRPLKVEILRVLLGPTTEDASPSTTRTHGARAACD